MRKGIAKLTLAALLFGVWSPVGMPAAEAASVTVLSENFDSTTVGQVPSGWVATTGANLVGVAEETGGNRYLSTSETNNSVPNTANYDFAAPITSSFSVDLRAMTQQTTSSYEGYFLLLRDSAGDKVLELLFNGSTISRRYGSNLKATVKSGIVANQWYNVHVDVDMDAKTYSVTIDGVPITSATNVALYKAATEVTQYGFSSYRYQSGTMRVDDLVVNKEFVAPPNQAPTAVSLNVYGTPAPGQVLTGGYLFTDADGDSEAATTLQWYRGTLADGSNKTAIAGAVSPTYTVASGDAGGYVWFEVTPVAAAGVLVGTPALSAPVYIPVQGNVVPFDGTGRFTDELTQWNYAFRTNGASISGGSAVGIGGDFAYYAGASDFKSLAIDVTYNKWALNFSPADDLSVYEASYNSQTGSLVDGKKVTLVRRLHPELMSGVQYVKATYALAEPLTPGTKYVHVKLPQAGYFSETGVAGDFKIDLINFESSQSTSDVADGYVIDPMADFSMYAAGGDTSNLQAVNLTGNLSSIRTFGTTTYVKRINTSTATTAMTYAAPSGKDFKSAYIEGYYFANQPSSPSFELWTSTNGTDFTQYNLSGIYKHPAFGSSANNSIPDVLQANFLPDGVKYVRVRLVGNIGNGFPYITKLAFGYGEEVAVQPVDTDVTIRRTSSSITIDGVVETDSSGNPAGQWAGSERIHIEGVTDNNGDHRGADVFLKYDEKKLYIGAKIKDPTPMVNTKTGTGIWNGDVLEIFFGDEDMDYTQHPDLIGTMLSSDRQLVLGSGTEYGYQSYLYTNGVNSKPLIFMELVRDTDGKGYTMEAAVPLYALGIANPWSGKALILNAVLSDGGYASRGQWGWTTNGEAAKKARGQWGSVSFETSTAPAAEMTLSASYNASTHVVTVTGHTLSVNNSFVTLTVKNPAGAVNYLAQTVSNGSGNFTFSYSLSGSGAANGTYTVKVGGAGIQVPQTTTFVVNNGQ
ncbi:sugar-binding protein [Paenibacillus oryzisoli]|uniref:sugar-binding protein n=1 Tax=Paenibacillus oryzisoli TaxID=1850517 RepID=UPI003D28C0E2